VSLLRKISYRTLRRAARVRNRLAVSQLRVSVFRSARHIYAQIIDDSLSRTLASCSSFELKSISGDKKAKAHLVGQELAKRAQEKGIKRVAFDRGGFLFHGRVAALAAGLRAGGLEL
jgi:large subunit ribosomal protein L18